MKRLFYLMFVCSIVFVGCDEPTIVVDSDEYEPEPISENANKEIDSSLCSSYEGIQWVDFTNQDGISIIELSVEQLNDINHRYYYEGQPYTGSDKSCHENGTLWAHSNYVNGLLDGKSISIYDNGQLRHQTYYVMGRKQGEEVWYKKNGKFDKRLKFKYGIELSCEGKCY